MGQTELDIMRLADTTVVVLVPESGDAIQTMKAGLMEAADIFVVNKADRAGAPALMAELKFAAHLHYASPTAPKDVDWEIPVLAVPGPGRRRHRRAAGRDPPPPRRRWRRAARFEARRRRRRRAELQALLVEEFRGAACARGLAERSTCVRRSTRSQRATPIPYSAAIGRAIV